MKSQAFDEAMMGKEQKGRFWDGGFYVTHAVNNCSEEESQRVNFVGEEHWPRK